MRTRNKQVATALFRVQSPITLVGQVVKTSPFHGEITGSTPVRVIYRCPFADIFTQSIIDTLVSLAENGHFIIVL